MKHTCHARGCGKNVPPRLLMCLPHWRMVPRDLQRAIWRVYVPGQERNHNLVTSEYMAVQKRAVDAVAALEAPPSTSSESEKQ